MKNWIEVRAALIWLVASIAVLFLMLTHTSEPAQVLNRFSTNYAVLLGAMLGLVGIAAFTLGLAWLGKLPRISLPQTRRMSVIVALGGIFATSVVWLLVNVSYQPAPLLFRLYVTTLVFCGMVLLLRRTNAAKRLIPTWMMWSLTGTALVTSLLLAGLYLGEMPPLLHIDEPWHLSRAYSSAALGWRNGSPLMALIQEPLNTALVNVLMGRWMLVFGFGLEQGRAFLLLLGFATVLVSAATVWRLYGKLAGLAGAAIGLFIPLMHNYLRPDVAVALAVSVALYFYFAARAARGLSGGFWRDIVVGVALGFGIEGHVYSVSFIAAFGVMYVYLTIAGLRRGEGARALLPLVGYAVGGLLYGLFFIWFRIPEGVSSLVELQSTLGARYSTESNTGRNAEGIEKFTELAPFFYTQYLTRHPVEFSILVFGIAAALWRARFAQVDRVLLALFAVATLVLLAVLTHHNPYYWIYNLPFVVICAGAGLAQINGVLTSQAPMRLGMLVTATTLVLIFALFTVERTERVNEQSVKPLVEIGREIAALLPPDTPIIGAMIYYVAMPENQYYYSDAVLEDGSTTGWEWDVPMPQAAIVTRGLDNRSAALNTYIQSADLQLARCYETSVFERMIALYTEAALLPQGAPINCEGW
ncbi:MAG: hypothetical protein H7175_22890 [Burkholderiales bacterium]|nr:hypothetical protein [Anaerolineae bacterium]